MAVANQPFVVNTNAADLLKGLQLRVMDKKDALEHTSRSLVDFLKRYYRKKDAQEPNQLGGERTHFWKQIARSVQQVPKYNTYNVAIMDYRFRQKLYGGVIKPKKAKYLTIPMKAASYGQTVNQFQSSTGINLRFRRGRGTNVGVLAGQQGRGGATYYYLLAKSVTQKPWPNTLPPAERLGLRVQRSFRYWLKQRYGNAVT